MNVGCRLHLIAVLAVALISCDANEPVVIPDLLPTQRDVSPTPSSSPSASSSTVSCRGLLLPTDKEVNTNLDRESGLLDISFHERGRNRNVTIAYRDDPWCRRNRDVLDLLIHVGGIGEILGCLDLPDETPEGMTRVELWFHDRLDPQAVGSSLLVRRDIPSTDGIASATLEAWIEGPTGEERRAGAIATAPEGTDLLGVDIDDNTAIVDLSGDFEYTGLGTTYEGAVLDALAGTLTQFDGVDRGLLKIDGEFKDYYMGHGYIVNERHPLERPHANRYRVAKAC